MLYIVADGHFPSQDATLIFKERQWEKESLNMFLNRLFDSSSQKSYEGKAFFLSTSTLKLLMLDDFKKY